MDARKVSAEDKTLLIFHNFDDVMYLCAMAENLEDTMDCF